jgi:hypothetical protein
MNVSLIYTLPGAKLDELTLDATVKEQHTSRGEVTDFPVETGSEIADHKRVLPDRLKIEGVVSNTPLPSQTTSSSGSFDDDMQAGVYSQRAETAYCMLLAIHQAGIAITVLTPLRQYANMEIENLDVPREASVGDVLRFSIDLKQIVTVNSQTVNVPKKAKASTKQQKQHDGTKPKEVILGPQPRIYSGLNALALGDTPATQP